MFAFIAKSLNLPSLIFLTWNCSGYVYIALMSPREVLQLTCMRHEIQLKNSELVSDMDWSVGIWYLLYCRFTDEARKYIDESNDNPLPRRSKPSIKFLTDVEPVVIESNVNKRGLLRAPTPYPKELRALAKHASHIHNRQSKEHNGDIVNTVRLYSNESSERYWSHDWMNFNQNSVYFRMNQSMMEIIRKSSR